jgi:AraC family transcriptional regulator
MVFHRRRSPDTRHDPGLRYLRLLGRAATYLDAHLDSPLDAATLAAQAAMSRHHFHRLFQAHFGLTVGGYLTWRRLQRACQQLVHTAAPVLDVAVAAGFGSAQALAKAMQRELGLTPTAVRGGCPVPWSDWLARQRIQEVPLSSQNGRSMLRPKWRTLPDLLALTASGWGMKNGHMTEAARQGFGELIPALAAARLLPRVTRCLAFLTEAPQWPDDPACEMLTGALFGHDPHSGKGDPEQPAVELGGSLRWQLLPGGNYAVFTHVGPYTGLSDLWTAIYRHWVPTTGYRLRDAPGFDLYLDDPRSTLPDRLRTELHLPIQ